MRARVTPGFTRITISGAANCLPGIAERLPIGTHTLPTPRRMPGGITPTTVKGWLSISTVSPVASGRSANSRRQSAYSITASGRPTASGPKVRPARGFTPATVKNSGDTMDTRSFVASWPATTCAARHQLNAKPSMPLTPSRTAATFSSGGAILRGSSPRNRTV